MKCLMVAMRGKWQEVFGTDATTEAEMIAYMAAMDNPKAMRIGDHTEIGTDAPLPENPPASLRSLRPETRQRIIDGLTR
jgi:hypothetical protein